MSLPKALAVRRGTTLVSARPKTLSSVYGTAPRNHVRQLRRPRSMTMSLASVQLLPKHFPLQHRPHQAQRLLRLRNSKQHHRRPPRPLLCRHRPQLALPHQIRPARLTPRLRLLQLAMLLRNPPVHL
ncbi:hypothetical protein CTA2_5432 [Colletotrichum tanaceti]|nr:hypothetical protein CTA2_5432 [Colletotrichum tanaceti]